MDVKKVTLEELDKAVFDIPFRLIPLTQKAENELRKILKKKNDRPKKRNTRR